jgi:hypothetical protein
MMNNFGDSPLAIELKDVLAESINQRLNTEISGLLQYLHTGDQHHDNLTPLLEFDRLSKSTLTKLIAKLVQQLSGGENDSESAEAIESADDDAPEFVAQSLSERLNMAIEKANQAEKKTIASKNVVKKIKCEITAFEQRGIRGPNLTMCYGYLKSIPIGN